MRINHNISALNASNRLKANDNAISKNLQKLSSGYRINSAADDAAGLAVSEKMRAQINGLNQAEDNAQNGISLVQTAEGGLNETESILQRMNTLAVESSNGTYKNETDRANLNMEVDALKSEIDRISTSTNFNGINLLDGSLGYTLDDSDAKTNIAGLASVAFEGGNLAKDDILTVSDDGSHVMTVTAAEGGNPITGLSFTTVATTDNVAGSYTIKAKIDDDTATAATKAKYDGLTITVNTNTDYATASATGNAKVSASNVLSLQIGSDNKTDQRVSLTLGDMSSKGLAIQNVSIATQDDAKAAIDTIKNAINTVSASRSKLGALQNRLEHTTNNLSTMSENLTSAESTIRDVDMSSEMVDLTKNQILEQAATSMLAQANGQPQSVLSLLKG
ncbi:flagellin [Caproicibacter sp.]|uniref:flagellin N-terminal helical domain-containing protein n=1 Tax=Caproicibacter sp. TaxID=2814884 RepID=UPI00398A1553